MEKEQLLIAAQEDFFKAYKRTPKQAGYPEASTYKKGVVFSRSQEALEAFSNVQKLTRKITLLLLSTAFLFVISLGIFLYGELYQEKALIYIFSASTFILLVTIALINLKGVLKCGQKEDIYLQKGTLLFYNGTSFYPIEPDPLHPETCFL